MKQTMASINKSVAESIDIECPHCNEISIKDYKYRTGTGSKKHPWTLVFECGDCGKDFRIDRTKFIELLASNKDE